MAYSDYGAFVWLNGNRRKDKEDVAAFATDEETFGTDSANIPSGARLWVNLIHQKNTNNDTSINHGVLGDGDIRVICYKQGRPTIVEATENGFVDVPYCNEDTDPYDYDIHFEYKGYKFYFSGTKPYYAQMTTPDGNVWESKYDYGYGAGFSINDNYGEDLRFM